MYKELQKIVKKLNASKFVRLYKDSLVNEIHATRISIEYVESLSNIELLSDYSKAYADMRAILTNYSFDNLYEEYCTHSVIDISAKTSRLRVYKTVNDMSVAVINFDSLSFTDFVEALSAQLLLLHVVEHFSKSKITSICIVSTSIYSNTGVNVNNVELYSVELNPKLTSLDDFNEFDFNVIKSPTI